MRARRISGSRWVIRSGSRASGIAWASRSAMPSRRSAWASNMTPPSELIRPPSKAAVILLWQTAGKQNGQERFMREDVGGLLRDKTRPGCELLEAGIIERVLALTSEDPPGGKAPLG